jgi:hypothetical protein
MVLGKNRHKTVTHQQCLSAIHLESVQLHQQNISTTHNQVPQMHGNLQDPEGRETGSMMGDCTMWHQKDFQLCHSAVAEHAIKQGHCIHFFGTNIFSYSCPTTSAHPL